MMADPRLAIEGKMPWLDGCGIMAIDGLSGVAHMHEVLDRDLFGWTAAVFMPMTRLYAGAGPPVAPGGPVRRSKCAR